MVTIESSHENAFLTDYIGRLKVENYWIGLTAVKGEFRWNGTGSIPTFTDWGPYQPSDTNRIEDCVEFFRWGSRIHWNDRECTFKNVQLCEQKQLILPDSHIVG